MDSAKQGFRKMGQFIETPGRTAEVVSLNASRDVLLRRADMATQCECLAMWDDERECICDKAVEIPLSADMLDKAHSLVRNIKDCDRRIAAVVEMPTADASCEVSRSGRITGHSSDGYRQRRHYEDGGFDEGPVADVTLPKAIILAALREERADLMHQLQETGIVSVDSAKIRGVLK